MSRGKLGALVLTCLAPLASTADAASTIDLTGTWRATLGDDLAWRAPDFDDQAWRQVHLPEVIGEGIETGGWAWYRRTISVDRDRWDGAAVGLALGWGLGTAYEVYADGVRIGTHGRLEPSPREGPGESRAFEIPAAALADGRVTFALRVWQYAASRRFVSAGYRWSESPFVVGPLDVVTPMAAANWHQRKHKVIVNVFLGIVLILLGLFHLLAWRGRIELAAYGWYGGLVALLGTNGVLYVRGEPIAPFYRLETSAVLEPLISEFIPVLGWEFLFVFFAVRRPRAWWIFWLVTAVQAIAWSAGWDLISPAIRFASLFWRFAVLLGVTAVICWSAWRGLRAARIVGAALLVSVLTVAIGELGRVGMLPAWTYWVDGDLGIGPSAIGTLLFVGAMAFALADRVHGQLVDLDAAHRASARFVPNAFLTLLGRDKVTEVERGDAVSIDSTILFADIRGFTTLSEDLGPERTFEFMNAYHAAMEPLVEAEGGFINQYYGDGIMALFPCADAGVLAARAMVGRLESFNAEDGRPTIEIGVGVHTGRVMLGTIGGAKRLDTGVISDVVNTASRLEGLTKRYDVPILCSGTVFEAMDSPAELERLDEITPDGKRESVALYAVRDA